MISQPQTILDQLILYLYFVHSIDWYSDSWEVKEDPMGLTVRPEPGVVVVSSLIGRKQEVESYLRRLTYRTDLFLQVTSKHRTKPLFYKISIERLFLLVPDSALFLNVGSINLNLSKIM